MACRSLSVRSCVSVLAGLLHAVSAACSLCSPRSGQHACLQVELPAQGRCAIKSWAWRRGQQTQVSWSSKGLQPPALSARLRMCSQSQSNSASSRLAMIRGLQTRLVEAPKRRSLPGSETLPRQCAAVQLRQQSTACSACEAYKQGLRCSGLQRDLSPRHGVLNASHHQQLVLH